MKACLLVIDMQNDFLAAWDRAARQNLFAKTNELIGLFRQNALEIIWVYQAFRADLSDAFLEMRDHHISNVIEGTEGAKVASELDMQSQDTQILKKRYSPFFKTSLDEELARLKPELIVMAGVNTHACIRMAAIDAYQRDHRVVLASDCIGSLQTDHAAVSLDYMKDKIARVLDNAEIGALLREL